MIGKEMLAALGLYVAILSSGQLLFKKAAQSSSTISGIGDVRLLITNHWLWMALILYGVATVLWVAILQRVPLSTAVLFNALCFVLVPLSAAFFFGESVGWRHAIGIALIVSGLLVVAR
ncbi:EamA family transporter [Dongia sp.]|uniref:EamA family transporter n=1 Tax=Dongia sp. TaxID=1977262 RepID=UPI0035B058A1